MLPLTITLVSLLLLGEWALEMFVWGEIAEVNVVFALWGEETVPKPIRKQYSWIAREYDNKYYHKTLNSEDITDTGV